MQRVLPPILPGLLAAFMALAVAAQAKDGSGNKKPPDPSGSYSVTVGGYLTGNGTASANAGKISISASVTDESGNKGSFSADLSVDNTNHFTGTGSALGIAMRLSGRIDAAGQDSALKTKRFVCTFKTVKDSQHSEEHHGRVVGFVDLSSSTPNPGTTGDNGGGSGGSGGTSGGGTAGGTGGSGGGGSGGTGSGGDGGGDDHGGTGSIPPPRRVTGRH
jgi:hypothetical protein